MIVDQTAKLHPNRSQLSVGVESFIRRVGKVVNLSADLEWIFSFVFHIYIFVGWVKLPIGLGYSYRVWDLFEQVKQK